MIDPQFYLRYVRGDDHSYQIELKDKDGNPVDITDWTFWLTAKREFEDTDDDAVIQATREPPHDDPANGLTAITIPSDAVAEDAQPDLLVCDIQREDASGNIFTLARGTMDFLPDVTRSTTV